MLADSQAGFTIIEVVVAALMVTLMAGAVATALISTATVSGDQRRRSQADGIAQQDQERMKGMSIKSLAGLDQTRYLAEDGTPWVTGTSTGTKYTVTSKGQFLSTTGSSSCTSSGTGAAAYVRVTSTVNWDANIRSDGTNIRPPIKQESLITPRLGGTLLINVNNQDGAGVPGTTITVYGSKETESVDTSSEGCAVFGGLTVGGYYIGAEKAGYVDPNGNDNPFTGATAGNGTTSPTPFKFGLAGNVTANFKTTIGGTTYSGQKAPSISWFNAGMTASKNVTPSTVPSATVATATMLYPFNNGTPGVYTNNYTVWAGSCDAATPPPANASYATVGPGGSAVLNDGAAPAQPRVKLPGLVIKLSYPTAGTYVTPDNIKLTDSCSQTWSIPTADIRPTTDSSFATLGALDYPGQPYGTYSVCVDYDPPGAVTRRVVTQPSVANTSFTAANPVNITMTSSSPGGAC